MNWSKAGAVLILGGVLSATAQAPMLYTNELSQYRFFEHAKWRALVLDVSTLGDVRVALGAPDDAVDMSRYNDPYPGDAVAKQPLFTYKKLMPGWEILIYFSSYCFRSHASVRESNHLCSIDLIPDDKIPFDGVQFPAAFTKRYEPGVEAPFFQWTDREGLQYETYVRTAPGGERVPGNLDRISYGVPIAQ